MSGEGPGAGDGSDEQAATPRSSGAAEVGGGYHRPSRVKAKTPQRGGDTAKTLKPRGAGAERATSAGS